MSGARSFIISVMASVLLTGCPGGAEHDEALKVERFVREKFPFPLVNKPTTGPTMYFAPGYSSTHLTVYRVVNAQDQERLIDLVRNAPSRTSRRPVHIVFLEEEHFVQTGNLSKRSDEKILRKVTVKD
jgi:hypothetical protein